MRNAFIVGILAGGLCVAGAVVVSADGDRYGDIPPGKVKALRDPGPTVDFSDIDGPGAKEVSPHRDVGPGQEVAAIKETVEEFLTLELAAGAMPQKMSDRAATTSSRRAEVLKVLAQVWAPGSLVDRRALVLKGVDLAESDPSYHAYDQARFIVTEWQGVTVDGHDAEAVLLGHDEYRAGSEPWGEGATSQVQIDLVKIGQDWKFVQKDVIFVEGR